MMRKLTGFFIILCCSFVVVGYAFAGEHDHGHEQAKIETHEAVADQQDVEVDASAQQLAGIKIATSSVEQHDNSSL